MLKSVCPPLAECTTTPRPGSNSRPWHPEDCISGRMPRFFRAQSARRTVRCLTNTLHGVSSHLWQPAQANNSYRVNRSKPNTSRAKHILKIVFSKSLFLWDFPLSYVRSKQFPVVISPHPWYFLIFQHPVLNGCESILTVLSKHCCSCSWPRTFLLPSCVFRSSSSCLTFKYILLFYFWHRMFCFLFPEFRFLHSDCGHFQQYTPVLRQPNPGTKAMIRGLFKAEALFYWAQRLLIYLSV